LGAEQEGRRRGAEAAELGVLLTDGVDAGVGLDERLAEGRGGPLLGVLAVGVRDVADCLGAGLLADRVAAHAVGHQEEVAVLLEPLRLAGRDDRHVVLVMAAAHADVGTTGVFDLVEAGQRSSPRGGREKSMSPAYRAAPESPGQARPPTPKRKPGRNR